VFDIWSGRVLSKGANARHGGPSIRRGPIWVKDGGRQIIAPVNRD
jgi:hypothetical protein